MPTFLVILIASVTCGLAANPEPSCPEHGPGSEHCAAEDNVMVQTNVGAITRHAAAGDSHTPAFGECHKMKKRDGQCYEQYKKGRCTWLKFVPGRGHNTCVTKPASKCTYRETSGQACTSNNHGVQMDGEGIRPQEAKDACDAMGPECGGLYETIDDRFYFCKKGFRAESNTATRGNRRAKLHTKDQGCQVKSPDLATTCADLTQHGEAACAHLTDDRGTIQQFCGWRNGACQTCHNTENGKKNKYDEVCYSASDRPGLDVYTKWKNHNCNSLNDEDFDANTMCCMCGGGTTKSGYTHPKFKFPKFKFPKFKVPKFNWR